MTWVSAWGGSSVTQTITGETAPGKRYRIGISFFPLLFVAGGSIRNTMSIVKPLSVISRHNK